MHDYAEQNNLAVAWRQCVDSGATEGLTTDSQTSIPPFVRAIFNFQSANEECAESLDWRMEIFDTKGGKLIVTIADQDRTTDYNLACPPRTSAEGFEKFVKGRHPDGCIDATCGKCLSIVHDGEHYWATARLADGSVRLQILHSGIDPWGRYHHARCSHVFVGWADKYEALQAVRRYFNTLYDNAADLFGFEGWVADRYSPVVKCAESFC